VRILSDICGCGWFVFISDHDAAYPQTSSILSDQDLGIIIGSAIGITCIILCVIFIVIRDRYDEIIVTFI